MYGFHKVSDVFQHGTPDATLWEFKHGNGNFKRGDLVGLREIKRRASRHALVHREFSSQKPPPSQPGTPAEQMPPMQEGGDPRLNGIEHTLYELSSRLQRHEENAQFMHVKHQTIMDTVSRLLQFNRELSQAVLALAPNPDNPIHRDGRWLHTLSFWYQNSLICPSLRLAARGPAANGHVPVLGGTPRAAFRQLPQLLFQYRECSGLPTAIAPRRSSKIQSRGSPIPPTKLLPPTGAF